LTGTLWRGLNGLVLPHHKPLTKERNEIMNTIRKNSQGYGYKYCDLAEIHRHMEEVGFSYWQEIETVGDEDYVITHILDATNKEVRKVRGCRVVKVSGKNPAQDYGSALTYARRYSLLLAFGLATADDDGAALNPKPARNIAKPERKVTKSKDKPYREAGVAAVKRLIEQGDLQLSEVKREVRRYGAEKMQDLSPDAFVRCVAALTKGRGTPA
jgi:integrase